MELTGIWSKSYKWLLANASYNFKCFSNYKSKIFKMESSLFFKNNYKQRKRKSIRFSNAPQVKSVPVKNNENAIINNLDQ